MDTLLDYHNVDIQWGNHDMLWMGAAAGNDACIACVIRIALRYANLDTIDVYKRQATDLPVEMDAQACYDLMVWIRGLAVPAARDIDSPDVQRGKQLFTEIGCATCHRPSWTTGDDVVVDVYNLTEGGKKAMPRYPKQKIWPYTDMIQHKLHMQNDIRTGWCRTTPLWGLSLIHI